ncbi:hypothetical protein GCM10027586_15120 [Kineococcus gypseus]|uniref:hypothetical protein n=1 Tax=Kineococcus gypseus TaxID=1637102 RepID=UPI003D7E3853
MDTTTTTGAVLRTAAATVAERCPIAWERSHASVVAGSTGGVRPDALAVRPAAALKRRVDARAYAFTGNRSTVPSSGTTTTSPPV